MTASSRMKNNRSEAEEAVRKTIRFFACVRKHKETWDEPVFSVYNCNSVLTE